MGRKYQPKDRVSFSYLPGPPKRIRVWIVTAGGETFAANLSTLDARFTATALMSVIDTAEADKVALRETGATAAKPKRSRPKTAGAKPLPRPSRLKRVEQAALALLAAMPDRERMPASARAEYDAIAEALGIQKPQAVRTR